MKKKLLMLLGVILVNSALWAVAPSSYVQFSINGNRKVPGFSQFSSSVPAPYNLGVVYRSPDKDKPNLGITGYQVVISTDREGFEYEDSHYMQVYIGVYDSNISNSEAYFDTAKEGLFIKPVNSSAPVPFGHQLTGNKGSYEPMNEVMSASEFTWSDGMVDNFVLPSPLVYDAVSNTYKQGEYQKGHSYVIAIHFTEIAHMSIGGTNSWHYPQNSGGEYSSFYWSEDFSKECLLAGFTYAADEATSSAIVSMSVNGEQTNYNLLGENQDPIDLGTIYSKEVTLASDQTKMMLPDLSFDLFVVESAVPVTYSEAAHVYGASMTFTTLKKSVADEHIIGGYEVDNRDYKTGNFGTINSDLVPAILCGSADGLVPLSENWAYEAYPLDVWGNWTYSGTHPVNVGWGYDTASNGNFQDGETYTVAFYFTEYNVNLEPAYIHRNGGKYYKFNFTYSSKTKEEAEQKPADTEVTIIPGTGATPGTATTTDTGVTVTIGNEDVVNSDGSVTFTSTITADAVKTLMESTTPGSATFLSTFKGIYLMVAEGKGHVDVQLETAGDIEMTAMCGTETLDTYSSASKGVVSINYNVDSDQWILLFPTEKTASARGNRVPGDNTLRIYDLKVVPVVTGIHVINAGGNKENVYYDLHGRKVVGNPTVKGIYINGRKKVLKK